MYVIAVKLWVSPWLNVSQVRNHFRHVSGLVVIASAYDTSGRWFESHSRLNLTNSSVYFWFNNLDLKKILENSVIPYKVGLVFQDVQNYEFLEESYGGDVPWKMD